MSDESDNLVLHLLREMRADMATKGELGALHHDVSSLRDGLGDLRHDVSVGFTSTTAALTAIARRLDELDHGVRLADRLTAIEKLLMDLEGRRGS